MVKYMYELNDSQISYFGLMEEGISFANNEYVNINLKIAGK